MPYKPVLRKISTINIWGWMVRKDDGPNHRYHMYVKNLNPDGYGSKLISLCGKRLESAFDLNDPLDGRSFNRAHGMAKDGRTRCRNCRDIMDYNVKVVK